MGKLWEITIFYGKLWKITIFYGKTMENHHFVMGKLTKYLQFSMSRSVKLPEGRLGWFIWIFMDHPYTSTWTLCFFVYGSPIIDIFWWIFMDHLGSPKNTTRYNLSSGGLWIVWFLPHNLAIAADHCRSVAFQAKHQTSTSFQSTSECAAASGTSFWRVGCVFLPTTLIWWTPAFLLHHRQTPQQGLPKLFVGLVTACEWCNSFLKQSISYIGICYCHGRKYLPLRIESPNFWEGKGTCHVDLPTDRWGYP